MNQPDFIDSPDGRRIALHATPGGAPGVVFMGGFRSDMTGSKATALEDHVTGRGHGFLRFDYSGHGQSSGRFEDGTVSDWLADSLAVIDAQTAGPQILVGSSMGGWLALLAALARPDRIAGLVLIAPAPDFTERLMWQVFSDATKTRLMDSGRHAEPNPYDDTPTVITRRLIEDGRRHLLLDAPIAIHAPVRILHGQADQDVPWRLSLELADRLAGEDVATTLVKSGDHRLSTPRDLARLCATLDGLLRQADDA